MKQFQQDYSRAVYSAVDLKTSGFLKTTVAPKEPEKPVLEGTRPQRLYVCQEHLSGTAVSIKQPFCAEGAATKGARQLALCSHRIQSWRLPAKQPAHYWSQGLFHTFLHTNANSNSVQWSRKPKRKKDPIVSVSRIRVTVSHTPFSFPCTSSMSYFSVKGTKGILNKVIAKSGEEEPEQHWGWQLMWPP